MKIILIGFMGSGKTVFGKKLANRLNLNFYDLDKQIESKYQMSIPSIFTNFDETVFRNLETKQLTEFINKDNFVLACGGGTPYYNSNMKLIKKIGISVYLELNATALCSRLLKSKTQRPLITGLSHQELQQKIETLLSVREKYYKQSDIIISGINLKPDKLINELNQL
ncbi:MAG: shikimate kinase [Bacteroidales bacterium]|nr:shikimate kinase [Bacteroidales bacterium]